jgi:hypothetical protein
MCKFQYSISIPKGSLQTRIPMQDTCFGHFDPLVGSLPVTPGGRRPDVWVSRSHITYSVCKFHHSISIPKGSLQTRIPIQDTCFGHFDPPVGSLPITPGGRWVDVWVSRSHITYSMCKFQYSISIPKGSLQTRIPIQDTCFGHLEPPVGSLPVTIGGRWRDVWASRNHITYSICKFHYSFSIPKGCLQTTILIHYGLGVFLVINDVFVIFRNFGGRWFKI